MEEVFTLPADQQAEVIDNALEAGPSVPFPSFARLFKTWLRVLAALPEGQREGLFSAYVARVAGSPEKLAAFNMDAILGLFLELDEGERRVLAGTAGRVVAGLDAAGRRRLGLVVPDAALRQLGA